MVLEYFDITLTPDDRFFFGGEIAFSDAFTDKDSEDRKRRSSYLIRSRILPQQTSLLGMLRYELLREARLLAPYSAKDNRQTEAEALVGSVGFVVGQSVVDYGAIHGLSPLRLHDGKNFWEVVPMDEGKDKKGAFTWKQKAGKYWHLEHYNPKNELSLRFAPAQKEGKTPASIFPAHSITGNRITNRHFRDDKGGEADEEGLFRQTFRHNVTGNYQEALYNTYTVRKEAAKVANEALEEPAVPKPSSFSFVFRVAIDTSVSGADAGAMKALEARQVTLGGEQSTFSVSVAPIDPKAIAKEENPLLTFIPKPEYKLNANLENQNFAAGKYCRIVFQSDVYLPKSMMDSYPEAFLLANTVAFRSLSSELNDATVLTSLQHNNVKKDKRYGRRVEGDFFTLLERGGLIIAPANDVSKIINEITSQEPFYTIGYNYCTHV